MTGVVAAIVEAFGELRVNKGRIFLALLGVAFSVFALTGVLGAGGMLRSALQQVQEQSSGRATIIQLQSASNPQTAEAREQLDETALKQFDQLSIEYRSRVFEGSGLTVQTGAGTVGVMAVGVDPDYRTMYRLGLEEGRWFEDSDSRRLAPAVVLNTRAYETLGRPALNGAPLTVYSYNEGTQPSTVTVIGVVDDAQSEYTELMYFLPGAAAAAPVFGEILDSAVRRYDAWVPADMSEDVTNELKSRVGESVNGPFWVQNTSHFSDGLTDVFKVYSNAIIGVAVVILILGAMGLLNISLVTIRYRVREIGIRRSYGATGARIFVGVLMESVVATFVAGVVGVTLAIALLRSPWVTGFMRNIGLVDIPAFPVSAALIGMSAAVLVGILAGVIPALIATRIKVIDAIRS